MMRAEKPPRSVIEEMARDGFKRRYPEGATRGGPPPRNIRPALRVLGADLVHVPFQGREYELGHVSFEDGMRLVEARVAVLAIGADADPTPERVAAYLGAMRLIVSMAPRYLLPVTFVRRLLWRLHLRRNPFRKATDTEVGQLLGFFLGCRTRSRVQYPTSAANQEPRRTS